jgi:tellurite resistance protein TehA-like permease
VWAWLKTLSPGYPALVMATGIIAVACEQQGVDLAARVLFVIAVLAYAGLAFLFTLRLAKFPREFISDLLHSGTGFTMLTTVAATNVVGSASAVIHGWWGPAWAMWWLSLPLLAFCLYTPLVAGVLRRDTPDLRDGINGTWFLITVSIESVAVLAGLLLAHDHHDLLAAIAVAAFGLGLLLYVVVTTLIFARWVFTRSDPHEIHPPAWIAAGAVAITTLAGSNLIAAAPQVPRLEGLVPFLEGVTLLAWATATFWFPVMIAVGIWRHFHERVPITYDPSYWALVFPLGMYSAATFAMLGALEVDHLDWLPKVALTIAAVAWLAASYGFLHRIRSRFL